MIIVFGSINQDINFSVDAMPSPGETVLCTAPHTSSNGGKGANQALAAARLGGKVAFVGCIGEHDVGDKMLASLRREGVVTSGVAHHPKHPTGTAIIIHDKSGENEIIVSSGANLDARADQIPDEILTGGNVLLLQMEVELEQNWEILRRAHEKGLKTFVNAAPFAEIPDNVFGAIDYLIVNEIEAVQTARCLGLKDQEKNITAIAQTIAKDKDLICIVTLGQDGALAIQPNGHITKVPALPLDNVVDTTGAGDAFCGTFCAAIHAGFSLNDSMRKASVASGLACTKMGTQPSYAYSDEIKEKMEMLPAQ